MNEENEESGFVMDEYLLQWILCLKSSLAPFVIARRAGSRVKVKLFKSLVERT